MNLIEKNEIYNSLIKELHLSNSVLEQVKDDIEALAKSRVNICKLLKMSKFDSESLNVNKRELVLNINKNKCSIEDCEEKQIQLKHRIDIYKSEIKTIRLHLSELEDKLLAEQQESRKLREALHIFISREKFKIIKKILLRSHRKVFLKYYDESIIKTKIMESTRRREITRKEKQSLDNIINSHIRKIAMDKRSIAQMRKSIINMQKFIDFSNVKLKVIENYKEMEKRFRAEIAVVNSFK